MQPGIAQAVLNWLAYPSMQVESVGEPSSVYAPSYYFDVAGIVRSVWEAYNRGECRFCNAAITRGPDIAVSIAVGQRGTLIAQLTLAAVEEPEGEYSVLSAYILRGPVSLYVVTRFIGMNVSRIDVGFEISSEASSEDVEWLASTLEELLEASVSDAASLARVLDRVAASGGVHVYMEIVTPLESLSAYSDGRGVYALNRGLVTEDVAMRKAFGEIREYVVRHGRRFASFEVAVQEMLFGRER